jgi:uncharacterized membrane-anchored protein
VGFRALAERFVGGDVGNFLDARLGMGFGQLAIALVSLSFGILLCWFLHHKKLFLRV